MRRTIEEITRAQRPLVVAGGVFAALGAALAALALADPALVAGAPRWIKPLKFAVSIAVYLWTIAAYLHFVAGERRAKTVIAWGSIALMAGEMTIIALQAARGLRSHFNTATALDGALFALMGAMIAVNTALVFYLLFLCLRARIELSPALAHAMRLGVALLILACLEGGVMSGMLRHTVGGPDDGAGLPLVNWSRVGGDLRVAHFVGMHAFQALPLFALALERIGNAAPRFWTNLFAAAYLALFLFTFAQALAGRPLF